MRTAPTPSAIAGFAEAVAAREAPLLDPLLNHPEAKVRAAAIRALRHLDAVDAGRLTLMLRDPSAAVVREAAVALRPIVRSVPADLLRDLLADPRTELRRAAYRLLTAGPARTGLHAGLIAAVDPDPRLAARARADLTRLARDAAVSSRLSGTPGGAGVTAGEHGDLTSLLRRATPVLGPDTSAALTFWLDVTAGG